MVGSLAPILALIPDPQTTMSLKAQLEAIIYAAETPITLEQMTQLVKETVIAEGAADEAEMKSRVR
ncbi:MAG: hypothetical protein DMG79_13055, partial [Acidobacteria bacterium]